ncbi:MAG: hypothetical protein HY766_01325 [candidate division NC10 bacterium]|nr:hypothetical protein [candidate division NC10 bacterium]
MPRQDGRDGPALILGGGMEWRGRDPVSDADGGAGGLERGQPVAVCVQAGQVLDLDLKARAGPSIAARSSTST